jgi:anti-sigma-K factor RskA
MNVMPTQTTTYTMTVQGPGGSQTAQATVTIISGGVSVSITPNPVTIDVTKTAVFTATATNILNNLQNTAVTWMVVEPTGGSIVATGTNNGQCTALYTAPGIPGTYHVMATSVADPTQSAMATVTVQSGNAIITVQ